MSRPIVFVASENDYCFISEWTNCPSYDNKVKHIVNSNRAMQLDFELSLYGRAFSMANFSKLSATGTRMSESEKRSGLNEYVNSFFDQSLTWADVKWLKAVTDLPVVVKGVLTGESSKMYTIIM